MAIVETKTETFPVAFNVPQQRVWDLLCCGMEGGSYSSFRYVDHKVKAGIEVEYGHIDPPFHGGHIRVTDKYQESEAIEAGEKVEFYKIDREALKRGLAVMGEKYPHLMSSFINDNEDVITGDAFIQCALLGEIVYG